MMARFGWTLLLAGATCAWGQSAISAHSGMIHYVEGAAQLDGQPVEPKFGEFPEVKNDSVLETGEGRAEVLLTPGVFLRLAENSSFKMLSNRLSDTAIEVLSGSVMFEADELLKDNAITVRYKDATMALSKQGLYRVDADQARLRVYDGMAEVTVGGKTIQAHKGKQVELDDALVASGFDVKDTDAFYRWASRRSENIAAANVSSARAAGQSGVGRGVPCNTFATTSYNCNSNYGYGSPYGSPYGSWAWNPYFGMFTYLPAIGYGYNPFGWAYYSPYTVGAIYVPGYYYNGGRPVYGNTGNGPTALSGGPRAPASLANTGSASANPLRAASTAATSGGGATSSAGQIRSTGGGSTGGGSVSSGSTGGGSVSGGSVSSGAGSGGAARSAGGGGSVGGGARR